MILSVALLALVLLVHGSGTVASQMSLMGEGSHRTIVYHQALLSGLVHAARNRCARERAEDPGEATFVLLQRLPIELFVDPHELHGIERSTTLSSGGGKVTFGLRPTSVDIELPSFAISESITVLITFSANYSSQQKSVGPLLPPLQLPLHARYPSPQQCSQHMKNRSAVGWSWLLSSHVRVIIEPPSLLLDCNGDQVEVQVDNGQDKQGQVAWLIPAGCLEHEAFVAWGTLIASIGAALSIALYARR